MVTGQQAVTLGLRLTPSRGGRIQYAINATGVTRLTTVYLRYRRSGTLRWMQLSRSLSVSRPSVTGFLPDVLPTTRYEVQIALDVRFTQGVVSRSVTSSGIVRASVVVTGQVTGTTTLRIVYSHDSASPLSSIQVTGAGTQATVTEDRRSLLSGQLTIGNLQPDTSYTLTLTLQFVDGTTASDTTLPLRTRADPDDVTAAINVVSLSRTGTSTQTEASVLLVMSASGSATVYMQRRRRGGSTAWADLPDVSGSNERRTVRIRGLSAGNTYEVRASTDPNFSSARTASGTVRTTIVGPTTGPPNVTQITEAATTETSITVEAAISNPDSSSRVYFRYQSTAVSAWTNIPSDNSGYAQAATVRATASGLTAGQQYRFEASLDSNFQVGTRQITLTTESDTRPTIIGGNILIPYMAPIVLDEVDLDSISFLVQTVGQRDSFTHIYWRYRVQGTTEWTDGPNSPISRFSNPFFGGGTVTGLTESTNYEIQASLTDRYPAPTTGFNARILTQTLVVTTLTDTTPRMTGLTAVQQGADGIRATATAVFTANLQMYWRIRKTGTDDAHQIEVDRAANTLTRDFLNLEEETSYTIDASLESNFRTVRSATVTTGFTKPAIESIDSYVVSAPDASGNRDLSFTVSASPSRTDWVARAQMRYAGESTPVRYSGTATINAGGTTTVTISDLPPAAFQLPRSGGGFDLRPYDLHFRAVKLTTPQDAGGQAIIIRNFTLPSNTWPRLTGIEVIETYTNAALIRYTGTNLLPFGSLSNDSLRTAGQTFGLQTHPVLTLSARGGGQTHSDTYTSLIGTQDRLIDGLRADTEYTFSVALYGWTLSTTGRTLDLGLVDLNIDEIEPEQARATWLITGSPSNLFLRIRPQAAATFDRSPYLIFAGATEQVIDFLDADTAYLAQLSPSRRFPDTYTLSAQFSTTAYPTPTLGAAIELSELDAFAGTVKAAIPVANPRGSIYWRYRTGTEAYSTVTLEQSEANEVTLTGLIRGATYAIDASLNEDFTAAVSTTLVVPATVTVPSTVQPPMPQRYVAGDLLYIHGDADPVEFNRKVALLAYLRQKFGNAPSPDLTEIGRDGGERIVLPAQSTEGRRVAEAYTRRSDNTEGALIVSATRDGRLVITNADGSYVADLITTVGSSAPVNSLLVSDGAGGVSLLEPPTRNANLAWRDGAVRWEINTAPTGLRPDLFTYSPRTSAGRFVSRQPPYLFWEFEDDTDRTAPHTYREMVTFPNYPASGQVRVRVFSSGGGPNRVIQCRNQNDELRWQFDTAAHQGRNRLATVVGGETWSVSVTSGNFSDIHIWVSARLVPPSPTLY